MFIYAGIDEAGYGPMFGPLVVGCSVLGIENHEPGSPPPDLWEKLHMAVRRDGRGRRSRIQVNDSKKLYTRAKGLARLEEGVLSFAALGDTRPASLAEWLEAMGDFPADTRLAEMPWYAPGPDCPWDALPQACTADQISIAAAMLRTAAKAAGVRVLDTRAAVVFEDQFNQMVARMRSKAAMSFTFVARHLEKIWNEYGEQRPTVVVDRQSGRRNYRELLALMFDGVEIQVQDESPARSAYFLRRGDRSMTVSFEVEAEVANMPVALASMISKYTRELLMHRFQSWFQQRAPHVRPTAGYATDARRFREEITPVLAELAIEPKRLVRMA